MQAMNLFTLPMAFSAMTTKSISNGLQVSLLAVVLLLSGCSWIVGEEGAFKDRRLDYKKARTAPTLEVPPDLSKSSIQDQLVIPGVGSSAPITQSKFSPQVKVAATGRVLPIYEGMKMMRDGSRRWLIVREDAEAVWPRILTFWQELGLLLTIEDPDVGIVETDWLENRADVSNDIVRNLLKKSLLGNIYSAPTRDKFRIRLEHGVDAGTTEIYLTHRGMEERDRSTDSDTNPILIWQPRPADPELEAEMLSRLMVYLGLEEQEAKKMMAKASRALVPQVTLIKNTKGEATLRIKEPFARAWRLTGLALDRVGFTVQDRDRDAGVYFVHYTDPYPESEKKGLLSRFAFWKSEEEEAPTDYLIQLAGQEAVTEVVVLDAQKQRDNSSTAIRILTLLREQFI